MYPGINSFTTISVTYVNEVLKFNSTQISILFLIVLTCTIPGSYFANWLADKTNPLIAFKLQIITFIMLNFVGFLILNNPTKEMAAYIMGFFCGFWLGWYYPLEKLIYSMIVPKGQESELAGFFLYCSQILTFLPPLVFALMNEAGINLKWGGIHLNIYMSVGLVFFHFMLPWRDCLEVAKVNAMRKNGMEERYDVGESDYFID
jgi:MFS-type transporter involved in bile tolerance (Atg22 family)